MINKNLELHRTKELLPQTLKGEKKPVKLTVLFEYEESTQAHPYGSTVAHEVLASYVNEEFFIDGVQMEFEELETFIKNFNPDIDLQEVIDQMQEAAVTEAFHP